MFEWSDIPVFLALARHGTTGKAAASLGVSQPTVVRRIAALERAVGLTLFLRGSSGFSLTSAGRALLEAADRAASAMQGVADTVEGLRQQRGERIRVTVLDQWETLLSPVIREHHRDWPHVQVQLRSSYRRFDIARGEADMALRAGVSFPEEDVLARQMPDCGWGIYIARDSEQPQNLKDLRNFPLAGGDGVLAMLPAIQWFERLAGPNGVAVRCNSFAAVRATIIQGVVGMLPCVAGGSDPALVPLAAPIGHLMVPLFLGVRREAIRRPPVRDLFERLSTHIHAQADLIGGHCPAPLLTD